MSNGRTDSERMIDIETVLNGDPANRDDNGICGDVKELKAIIPMVQDIHTTLHGSKENPDKMGLVDRVRWNTRAVKWVLGLLGAVLMILISSSIGITLF